MALETLASGPSDGAGYDDQNNNAYRTRDRVELGNNRPACETGKHRLKFEFSLEVL